PFRVSSSGSLTVSGGTITGATVRTSDTGTRVVLTGTAASQISFYSGDASELNPATIGGGLYPGQNTNALFLRSGTNTGIGAHEMKLTLSPDNIGGKAVFEAADDDGRVSF